MAQHVLDTLRLPYIPQAQLTKRKTVDFLLPKYKTVLEMDGPYWHDQNRDYDAKRDAFAQSLGLNVLRFRCAYATPQSAILLKRFLIRKLELNHESL